MLLFGAQSSNIGLGVAFGGRRYVKLLVLLRGGCKYILVPSHETAPHDEDVTLSCLCPLVGERSFELRNWDFVTADG